MRHTVPAILPRRGTATPSHGRGSRRTELSGNRRQVRHPALAVLLVPALAALTGCSPPAWVSHPMPLPPDRSCRTGGGSGHDVYIWDCIDGEHVVVSRYCGGYVGCRAAVREAVPCGETTGIEQRLSYYLEEGCRPPPRSLHWRPSPR